MYGSWTSKLVRCGPSAKHVSGTTVVAEIDLVVDVCTGLGAFGRGQ